MELKREYIPVPVKNITSENLNSRSKRMRMPSQKYEGELKGEDMEKAFDKALKQLEKQRNIGYNFETETIMNPGNASSEYNDINYPVSSSKAQNKSCINKSKPLFSSSLNNDLLEKIPVMKTPSGGGICGVCEKTFTRISTCKDHFYLAHGESFREKDKQCLVCKDLFAFDKNLSNHMKKIHGINDRIEIIGGFNGLVARTTSGKGACLVCCKVFTRLSTCKDHFKLQHKRQANCIDTAKPPDKTNRYISKMQQDKNYERENTVYENISSVMTHETSDKFLNFIDKESGRCDNLKEDLDQKSVKINELSSLINVKKHNENIVGINTSNENISTGIKHETSDKFVSYDDENTKMGHFNNNLYQKSVEIIKYPSLRHEMTYCGELVPENTLTDIISDGVKNEAYETFASFNDKEDASFNDSIENLCQESIEFNQQSPEKSEEHQLNAAEDKHSITLKIRKDIFAHENQTAVMKKEFRDQRSELNPMIAEDLLEEKYSDSNMNKMLNSVSISNPSTNAFSRGSHDSLPISKTSNGGALCEICGKIFTVMTSCKRHFMQIHAESFREKDKVCLVCQETFAFEKNLSAHMKKIHKINGKIEVIEESDGLYARTTDGQGVCLVCCKVFTVMSSLKRHLKQQDHMMLVK